ncbi:hypothetical protein GCM10009779_17720 [Polymorphospora rubra]
MRCLADLGSVVDLNAKHDNGTGVATPCRRPSRDGPADLHQPTASHVDSIVGQ